MKSSNDFFKSLKPGDFAIVFTVAFFCLVLFLSSFFSGERLKAEFYLNGELTAVIELSRLDEQGEALQVGGCEILVESDGVTFMSSACRDKLCIKRGKLKKAGDTMACVPERVTVVLKEADGGVDAVVY